MITLRFFPYHNQGLLLSFLENTYHKKQIYENVFVQNSPTTRVIMRTLRRNSAHISEVYLTSQIICETQINIIETLIIKKVRIASLLEFVHLGNASKNTKQDLN
jgi:hypothetical protein